MCGPCAIILRHKKERRKNLSSFSVARPCVLWLYPVFVRYSGRVPVFEDRVLLVENYNFKEKKRTKTTGWYEQTLAVKLDSDPCSPPFRVEAASYTKETRSEVYSYQSYKQGENIRIPGRHDCSEASLHRPVVCHLILSKRWRRRQVQPANCFPPELQILYSMILSG